MRKEDKLKVLRDLVLKVSNARFGHEVREFQEAKFARGGEMENSIALRPGLKSTSGKKRKAEGSLVSYFAYAIEKSWKKASFYLSFFVFGVFLEI